MNVNDLLIDLLLLMFRSPILFNVFNMSTILVNTCDVNKDVYKWFSVLLNPDMTNN